MKPKHDNKTFTNYTFSIRFIIDVKLVSPAPYEAGSFVIFESAGFQTSFL